MDRTLTLIFGKSETTTDIITNISAFLQYVKPITLKFTINPQIPILHIVITISTKFQSKILSFGVMAAI